LIGNDASKHSKIETLTLVFNFSKIMQLVDLDRFMMFNATFNNISVISWQSVLLMEETGVPGENHRPVAKFIT
jgi:hypothetical protein